MKCRVKNTNAAIIAIADISSTKAFTTLDGITNLVVDLKNLEYISSAGLRVLLGVAQVMEDQGDMKVINVSSEVMDIFEVTGFDEVLTIE